MSGAIFILAINASVAGLLAGAFFVMANYDRSFASARWVALAYALGAAYYGFEFLIAYRPDTPLLGLLGYATFLLALSSYSIGIACKLGWRPPWTLLAILLVSSVALNVYTQSLPRELILRNVLWQLPYAVLQAVPLVILLRTQRLGKSERALAAVLALSAVHFLLKPMVAAEAGGPGRTADTYIDTAYALFSQSSGTVLTVLVALATLAIYIVSMLSDANRRSETDTLSGLLNRRGFLQRTDETLKSASMPIALVLADIDNFKSVNDTFGHDAGDRVIQTFADVLVEAAGEVHVVGRIGGEEFAMLLAGTEPSTARLVAEGVRVALSQAAIAGLPQEERITASFGVAQWREGSHYDELFRQADAALYEAKNAGRDCVRVAPPPLTVEHGRDGDSRRLLRDRAR